MLFGQRNFLFYALALISILPVFFFLFPERWLMDQRLLLDGVSFYCAGKLALIGSNPYAHPAIIACGEGFGKMASPFIYPPWSLALLMPFSLLPFRLAMLSLLLGSVVALGFVYHALWRLYGEEGEYPRWLTWSGALLLAISFFPFHTLIFAQMNIFAMAAMMACVQATTRGSSGWAGFYLVCLTLIKFPIAPAALLMLVLMRRWQVIAYGLGFGAVVSLLVLNIVGIDVWLVWAQTVMPRIGYNGVASLIDMYEPNASLFGVLLRSVGDETALQMMPFFVLELGLIVGGRFGLKTCDVRIALPVSLLLAVLLSPMSWLAYFVYLLPALFWSVWRGNRLALSVAGLVWVTYQTAMVMPTISVSVPTIMGVVLLLLIAQAELTPARCFNY
jgi:hypothetical protein